MDPRTRKHATRRREATFPREELSQPSLPLTNSFLRFVSLLSSGSTASLFFSPPFGLSPLTSASRMLEIYTPSRREAMSYFLPRYWLPDSFGRWKSVEQGSRLLSIGFFSFRLRSTVWVLQFFPAPGLGKPVRNTRPGCLVLLPFLEFLRRIVAFIPSRRIRSHSPRWNHARATHVENFFVSKL